MEHSAEDQAKPKAGGYCSWPITIKEDEDGFLEPFRKFRIRQTGKRAEDLPLTLFSIELYGRLDDTIDINPLEIDSREVGRREEFHHELKNEFNEKKREEERKVMEREYKEDLWADFLIMKQNEEALRQQMEEEARDELYDAWKSIRKDKEDLVKREIDAKHHYNEALIETQRDEKREQKRLATEIQAEEIAHYKDVTHEFMKENAELIKEEKRRFLATEKERMMDKKAEKARLSEVDKVLLDNRWEMAEFTRKVAEAEELKAKEFRNVQRGEYYSVAEENLEGIKTDRETRIQGAESERQQRWKEKAPMNPYCLDCVKGCCKRKSCCASIERIPATPTQAAIKVLEKSPVSRGSTLLSVLSKPFRRSKSASRSGSAAGSPAASSAAAASSSPAKASAGSSGSQKHIHSKSQIKELDTITQFKTEYCKLMFAKQRPGYANPDGSMIDPSAKPSLMPKEDIIFWTDLNAHWTDFRDKQALVYEDRTYHNINYFDQKRDRVATQERMKKEDQVFLEELREKWLKEKEEKEEERTEEMKRKKQFNGDNLRSNRDLKIAQKNLEKEMVEAEIQHYIDGRHEFLKEQRESRKDFKNGMLKERYERVRMLRENKARSKSLKEGERSEKWWRSNQRSKMEESFQEEMMVEKRSRMQATREARAASPRKTVMSPRLAPGSPRYSPRQATAKSHYQLELEKKLNPFIIREQRGRSMAQSGSSTARSTIPGSPMDSFRSGRSTQPGSPAGPMTARDRSRTPGRSPTVSRSYS